MKKLLITSMTTLFLTACTQPGASDMDMMHGGMMRGGTMMSGKMQCPCPCCQKMMEMMKGGMSDDMMKQCSIMEKSKQNMKR